MRAPHQPRLRIVYPSSSAGPGAIIVLLTFAYHWHGPSPSRYPCVVQVENLNLEVWKTPLLRPSSFLMLASLFYCQVPQTQADADYVVRGQRQAGREQLVNLTGAMPEPELCLASGFFPRGLKISPSRCWNYPRWGEIRRIKKLSDLS